MQQMKREQEFHRLVQESNVKEEDRVKEMASQLAVLEAYKTTHEREKKTNLVFSKGDARTMNDLIEQSRHHTTRIQDLEGQLVSLYYVHQNQKEFEAEEEKEEELRKMKIKLQMRKDEELAQSFDKMETRGGASFSPSPKTGRRKTTGGVLSRIFGGKTRNDTTSSGASSTARTQVSPVNRHLRLAVEERRRSFSEEKLENEILEETKENEHGGSLQSIFLTFLATKGPYNGQIFVYVLGGDDYPLGEDITIGSDPDAIWCLKNDDQIENVHAIIRQLDPKTELLGICKRHGFGNSSVNDKQLSGGESMGIKDGDIIVLGSSAFVLSFSFLYSSSDENSKPPSESEFETESDSEFYRMAI